MIARHRLVFDHIPKTAGASIIAALEQAFAEAGTLPSISNAHRQAVSAAGPRRLLAGHLWFAPGEPLAEGWDYCTLLRDPLDRFLSQYWFGKSVANQLVPASPNHVLLRDPQVVAAHHRSLEQYVALKATRVLKSEIVCEWRGQ